MQKMFVTSVLTAFAIALPIAQDSGVIIHDLASAPFQSRTPGAAVQIKAVLTDDGSVGIALARGGVAQAPHRHGQEQVVLPLEAPMEFSTDGVTRRLEQYGAAIPPANAQHNYVTAAGGPATFIEYQPVRRDDWMPPYPPNKSAQSPEPVPVPSGRVVTRDLSPHSDGWTTSGVARSKELVGDQIKIVMMELKGRGSIEVPAAAAGTQFVHVIVGNPTVAAGSLRRELAPHFVVEMKNAARPIRLEPPREDSALIAIFSRIRK